MSTRSPGGDQRRRLERRVQRLRRELAAAEEALEQAGGSAAVADCFLAEVDQRLVRACQRLPLQYVHDLEGLLQALAAAVTELLPGATGYAVCRATETGPQPPIFSVSDGVDSYSGRRDFSGGLLACCAVALGDRPSLRWQRAEARPDGPPAVVAATLSMLSGVHSGLLLATRPTAFLQAEEEALAKLAAIAAMGMARQDALDALAESELRTEQQRAELEGLLGAITDGILILDATGTVISANPAAVVALGGDPSGGVWTELADRHEVHYVNGELVPLEDLPSRRALRGETVINTPYLYPQGGRWRYGEVSAAPLGDPEHPSGVVLTMRDVTTHHDLVRQYQEAAELLQHSQEELAQSERLYRSVAELLPYGIWISGPHGPGTYVSPSFSRLLGRDARLLSPEEYIQLHHPEDRERVRQACHIAYERGESVSIEGRVLGADGNYHWVLHRGAPLRKADGEVEAWVGVNLDISDLKATEQQRLQSLQREQQEHALLEAVMGQMPGSTLIVSAQGEVLLAHDRIAGITLQGAEATAALAASAHRSETLDGTPVADEDLPIFRALRCGDVTQDRLLRVWHAGAQYVFSISAEPVHDASGAVIAAVAVWYDVTDRANAEAELRRHRDRLEELVQERTVQLRHSNEDLLRQRETLRTLTAQLIQAEQREREALSVALHDTVIQSIAFAHLQGQLLAESTLEEETREGLSEMVQMLRRAVAQSRALLYELSPPVGRGMPLLEAFAELGRAMTADYGYEVTCCGDGEPPDLDHDLKVVLYRSVRELLINAAKHARATRVDISLGFADGVGEIVVTDDGRGMIETADVPEPASFGLLSIRERLDQLGGSLQSSSSPGHGTSFRLRFPVRGTTTEYTNS